MKRLLFLGFAALLVIGLVALPAAAADRNPNRITLVDDGGVWYEWDPASNTFYGSNSLAVNASGSITAVIPPYLEMSVDGVGTVSAGPADRDEDNWMGLPEVTFPPFPKPTSASSDALAANRGFGVTVKSNAPYYTDCYVTKLFKNLVWPNWPAPQGAASMVVEMQRDNEQWIPGGIGRVPLRNYPTAGEYHTYQFRAKYGWLTERGTYGGQVVLFAYQP